MAFGMETERRRQAAENIDDVLADLPPSGWVVGGPTRHGDKVKTLGVRPLDVGNEVFL